MSKEIITGIDIGTHTIKVVVSELQADSSIKVIGIGTASSQGMRNGYIVDLPEVTKSVTKALDNAVRSARVRPSKAYLAVGGESLTGLVSEGVAYIRNSDATISERDYENSITDAATKAESLLVNKKTLHDIPLLTVIDNEYTLGSPIGMQGSKLESSVMLVHALESHIEDFVSAVEDAGVEVIDVTASPLAASFAALTLPQKRQGCIMLDIGAESTDVIIYDNNTPISITVLPHGSQSITNTLAIDLRIDQADAEKVKHNPKHAAPGTQDTAEKSITKEMTKLFTKVKAVLKDLDTDTIFPAGVLITGGGAQLASIEEITKNVLKLPVKIVSVQSNLSKKLSQKPEMTVAYGLCLWGASNGPEKGFGAKIKAFFKKIGGWFTQFMP